MQFKLTNKEKENRTIVRVITSYWKNKDTVCCKKEIKTLRRKSKGWNIIEECFDDIELDWELIVNINDVSDGVYELVVNREWVDWETGVVDNWDYKLVRVDY